MKKKTIIIISVIAFVFLFLFGIASTDTTDIETTTDEISEISSEFILQKQTKLQLQRQKILPMKKQPQRQKVLPMK